MRHASRFVLLAALLTAAITTAATAQSTNPLLRRALIEQLRDRIDQVQVELRELENQVAGYRADLSAAQSEAQQRHAEALLARRRTKDARVPVTKAQSSVRYAQGRLVIVNKQLRKEIDASVKMQAALAAVREARREYDAVRTRALIDLRSDPGYQAAAGHVADVQGQLDELRAADDPPRRRILQLSKELLERQSVLTDLERAAYRPQPSFHYARLRWMKVTLEAVALRARLSVALYFHADRITAIRGVDMAKYQLQQVQAAYTQTRHVQAAAEAQAVQAFAVVKRTEDQLKALERDVASKESSLRRLQRDLRTAILGG